MESARAVRPTPEPKAKEEHAEVINATIGRGFHQKEHALTVTHIPKQAVIIGNVLLILAPIEKW